MTETSDRTNNLPKTVAFYQKANLVLRLALITAVLWPAFAIASAVLLTPSNAQTIVPLVTLSPLVPMVLFLLGAPYKYFLIAQDPDAKIGFRWAAALIAVELAIGVYFAVIPVSNDPGLTPLLILTASAIFFLRLAQIARWLRFLLALLLIGITIVFLGGGREKMQAAFTSPNSVPIIRVPPQPPSSPHEARVQTDSSETTSVASSLRQPRPFRPDWANAQQLAMEQFVFKAAPCIPRAAELHCFFLVTNKGEQVEAEIDSIHCPWSDLNSTRMIDDQGVEYRASSVHLGSSQNADRAINIIPPDVPVLASAVFQNVSGGRVAMLNIKFNLSDRFNHQLDFQFRDLPIQPEGDVK
jgi:hypothetical protein